MVMPKKKNEKAGVYTTGLPPVLLEEFREFCDLNDYTQWKVVAAGIRFFMAASPDQQKILIQRDPSQNQRLLDAMEGAIAVGELGHAGANSGPGQDEKQSKRG